MFKLSADWLESGPNDYELKKYKLLAAITEYGNLIKGDILAPVLDEIELHLENLYKFQHQKDILDDRMKTIKGIDLDNMELEYEYPENSREMEDIVRVANDAVFLFERLYKNLRERWRENEKSVKLSFIPDKKIGFKSGYFLITDYNNNLLIYSFDKPDKMNDNWKKFKLELIESMVYDMTALSNFVINKSLEESDRVFIRCDFAKQMPFEDCAFPLSKFVLFHTLKHNL